MKIKGAIFDMDGTLLDSVPVWTGIGVKYLNSIGICPDPETNEIIADMSLNQSISYFKKKYDIEKSEREMIDDVNKMVEGFYFEEVEMKPGVKELLKYLKEQGIKMCIATATDRYIVDKTMKRCGVREYFSEIFTCNDVGHGKDEPVIYEMAVEHMGTQAENTLVFEDALYAIRTAKKAGFTVVGIYDAGEKEQEKIKETVDYYVEENFLEFCKSCKEKCE